MITTIQECGNFCLVVYCFIASVQIRNDIIMALRERICVGDLELVGFGAPINEKNGFVVVFTLRWGTIATVHVANGIIILYTLHAADHTECDKGLGHHTSMFCCCLWR